MYGGRARGEAPAAAATASAPRHEPRHIVLVEFAEMTPACELPGGTEDLAAFVRDLQHGLDSVFAGAAGAADVLVTEAMPTRGHRLDRERCDKHCGVGLLALLRLVVRLLAAHDALRRDCDAPTVPSFAFRVGSRAVAQLDAKRTAPYAFRPLVDAAGLEISIGPLGLKQAYVDRLRTGNGPEVRAEVDFVQFECAKLAIAGALPQEVSCTWPVHASWACRGAAERAKDAALHAVRLHLHLEYPSIPLLLPSAVQGAGAAAHPGEHVQAAGRAERG